MEGPRLPAPSATHPTGQGRAEQGLKGQTRHHASKERCSNILLTPVQLRILVGVFRDTLLCGRGSWAGVLQRCRGRPAPCKPWTDVRLTAEGLWTHRQARGIWCHEGQGDTRVPNQRQRDRCLTTNLSCRCTHPVVAAAWHGKLLPAQDTTPCKKMTPKRRNKTGKMTHAIGCFECRSSVLPLIAGQLPSLPHPTSHIPTDICAYGSLPTQLTFLAR